MAITKQFLKTKPECKVKFSLTADECGQADNVALVGDFNQWNINAHPMKKQKNGDFALTLTLPAGTSNKFKYLADNEQWFNDSSADGYQHCSYAGCDNSVLTL